MERGVCSLPACPQHEGSGTSYPKRNGVVDGREVGFERQPCQRAGMGECRLARGYGQLVGEVGALCAGVKFWVKRLIPHPTCPPNGGSQMGRGALLAMIAPSPLGEGWGEVDFQSTSQSKSTTRETRGCVAEVL